MEDGLDPIIIPLITSSLSVSSAGNNGGYLMKIFGSGFTKKKSKINVTICGTKVNIRKSNGSEITFLAPSCSEIGPQAIYVTIGGITSSNLNFTFINATSPPTIDSITPNSANPTVKGIL